MSPVKAVRRKRALARYAKRHKLEIPKRFRPNWPGFGKPAMLLLVAAQKEMGIPVRTRGTWTEATLDVLFPDRVQHRFERKQVLVARNFVGVKEQPPGSNQGFWVRKFQAITGAYDLPWCGSFQAYVAVVCGFLKDHLPAGAADVTNWLLAADNKANPYVIRVKLLRCRAGDRIIRQYDTGDVDHIQICVGNYVLARKVIWVGGNEGDAVSMGWQIGWGHVAGCVRLLLHP